MSAEGTEAKAAGERIRSTLQRRAMRRFSGRAVYWLYRAAKVPDGQVWHPRKLARALFGEILTPTYTIREGRRYAPTETELGLVSAVARTHPAVVLTQYHPWQGFTADRRCFRTRGGELVVANAKDHAAFAWALGALACMAQESYFFDSVVPAFDEPFRTVEHLAAHAVADRLLRNWDRGVEE